jgi:predicted nucleic acid-binding protein
VIVVSDTSPLTNLAAIGQFDLLRQIYGDLAIPEAVWSELNAGGLGWPGRDAVADAAWVKRHKVLNQVAVAALMDDLDAGEAEAIILSLELGADLLLLDESEGRHHAQRLGLQITGVVGVLQVAKHHGLIDYVRPHLDALRGVAGFYISEALYRFVLQAVGEQ